MEEPVEPDRQQTRPLTEQATVPKVAVADPAMFDLGLFGGLDDDELAAAREEMKRGCGWG